MKKLIRFFMLMTLLVLPVALLAQAGNDKAKNHDADSSQVQTAVKGVQEEYRQKIAELEARIGNLEKEKKQAEQKSELEKLLKEAATTAAQKLATEKIPETKVFTSGERQQQALNPNLSVTGDFIENFSDLEVEEHAADEHGHGALGGKQFMLREAEFHIISNLDPYTRAKFFLGIPGGGSLHVGEAYMEWVNLPLNLALKTGKYRTQFGVLNRWHAHGLPQVDRPRVLTQFLGEGLSGFGAGKKNDSLSPNHESRKYHASKMGCSSLDHHGGDHSDFHHHTARTHGCQ